MPVRATFHHGSVVLCSIDTVHRATYVWLDTSTDSVISRSPELDVCNVSAGCSAPDLLCVVTLLRADGKQSNVSGNITADGRLWAAVRTSCTDFNSTNRKYAPPDPLFGWGGGHLLPILHPLDAFGVIGLVACGDSSSAPFGASFPKPSRNFFLDTALRQFDGRCADGRLLAFHCRAFA